MKKSMKTALLAVSTLLLILNSACASDYSFGTKVLATDSDIGKPLFVMPAGTSIAYWDTGVVPGYDDTDVVYLHTSLATTVTANDIRLTSFADAGFAAGSKVKATDNDIGMPLTPLPNAIQIRYLNIDGSVNYDLNDPVYVHQNTGPGTPGAFATVTNDVRLTEVQGYGQVYAAGTKVHDFEPDHNKILGLVGVGRTPALGPIGFFDVNGNGLYDGPDDVYLNFPTGVPAMTVTVNNLRLSGNQSR